jgi:hypothetical protein
MFLLYMDAEDKTLARAMGNEEYRISYGVVLEEGPDKKIRGRQR